MSASVTLLYILCGICLLLWGLRSVKRGVLRGYGTQVQKVIARGTRSRFHAFFSGLGLTLFLQSSTATALLTASFVGRGLMTTAAGLAIMIGADIGTSFVAQLLSFKIAWLGPLLLSIGIIFHLMYDDGSHKRFLARIIIGIGFMLLSLQMIRDASAPLRGSETLALLLHPLEKEPILALFTGIILTYIFHSSLSAVLLFASLASSDVLSLHLAILFVIGANVGGGIIPLVAVIKDTPQAVQIPLGNLVMRLVVGVATLLFMPYVLEYLMSHDWDNAHKVIFAHIGFNLVIMAVFLPFVDTLAKICMRLSPSLEGDEREALKPRYLDMKAMGTPSIALSCATRETLHLSEIFERMLIDSYDALAESDEDAVLKIKQLDNTLDHIYLAIKDYIIRLSREELDDSETEQSMRIMTFATNIEHCGDIVDKSLMELAFKKIKNRDQFSTEGLSEIKDFHARVLENFRLAQSIFLSSDRELAEQLIAGKRALKRAEEKTAQSHMQRLRDGLPETIATSELHTDIIRDYRRINGYFSALAYQILDGPGEAGMA